MEAAELYIHVPAFAEALHEPAREVGDSAVDFMRIPRNAHHREKGYKY